MRALKVSPDAQALSIQYNLKRDESFNLFLWTGRLHPLLLNVLWLCGEAPSARSGGTGSCWLQGLQMWDPAEPESEEPKKSGML